MKQAKFSNQLEVWLRSPGKKTLGQLNDVFGEKSFAIAIILLMIIPALPLPTGGITHIFEIITLLLGAEMVVGRKTVWVPKRWQNMQLGGKTLGRALPFIVKRIRWFEKFSKPRWPELLANQNFSRLAGLLIIGLTLAAFLSPPFSGLDTLPAMGAVIIGLAIVLEDVIVFVVGCLVGAAGIGLVVGLSSLVISGIHQLLH